MAKSIYTITTLCKKGNQTKFFISGPTRCVGYFFELEEARKIVENNYGDLFEYVYDYCVIKSIEPGIYNFGGNEYWYEWKDDGYKEIEKPEEFNHVACFGIG